MSRRVATLARCAVAAASVGAVFGSPLPAQAAGASVSSSVAGPVVHASPARFVGTSATPPSYLPVLHQGARGRAVSYLQAVLHLPVSGTYGARSVTTVKAFQTKNRITPADGVVRKATWTALIDFAKSHPPVLADVPPAPAVWAVTSDVWAKFDPEVERFARCVAHHESWRAGLWTARNPHTSASGAFQYLDSTWRIQSHRAGVYGFARAYLAPPDAQALTFAVNVSRYNSWSSWSGTHCGHGT